MYNSLDKRYKFKDGDILHMPRVCREFGKADVFQLGKHPTHAFFTLNKSYELLGGASATRSGVTPLFSSVNLNNLFGEHLKPELCLLPSHNGGPFSPQGGSVDSNMTPCLSLFA